MVADTILTRVVWAELRLEFLLNTRKFCVMVFQMDRRPSAPVRWLSDHELRDAVEAYRDR